MNPGFGYRATRNGDELTIHGVPIFVECSRGEAKFDADWLRAAVARAKQMESEGYLPPLHVRHHEPATDANGSVRFAGFVRITGAQNITFRGQTRLAVIADLVIQDPSIQVEVLQKRLPYRSVEIFDVDVPEIGSLALLDHEAPYLQLPMLMVSNAGDIAGARTGIVAAAMVENPWRAGTLAKSTDSVVACFRHGHSIHILMEESEAMTTTTKSTHGTPGVQTNFADDSEDKKPDEKKDGEKMEGDDGGGFDVKALVKAIEDGSISVADMEAITAAIESRKTAVEPEEPGDPSGPAPAAVPGGEAMKQGEPANSKLPEDMVKLQARVSAMEIRERELTAAQTRRDDVAKALTRLEGRPLGSDAEERFMAYHKEHGGKAFAAYVDEIVRMVGVLPTADGRAGAAFAAQAAATPGVAMKYQALGVDAVNKAAQFAAEWAELQKHGMTRLTEERHVEISMARHGIILKAQGA